MYLYYAGQGLWLNACVFHTNSITGKPLRWSEAAVYKWSCINWLSYDFLMNSLPIQSEFQAYNLWRTGATRNRLDTQWRYLGDITAAMFGALEYTTTIPIREQIRLKRLWFFYHDPRALTTSVSNKGSLRYKRRDMHDHLLASISKATITQGSLQVVWSTIAT